MRGELLRAQLVDAGAGRFRARRQRGAHAIGIERSWQQVVDRDIVTCDVARQAGDEARQTAARTVGQAEDVDRRVREIDWELTRDSNQPSARGSKRFALLFRLPSARAFSRSAVRRNLRPSSLAVLMDRFGLSHDPAPIRLVSRSGRICCAKCGTAMGSWFEGLIACSPQCVFATWCCLFSTRHVRAQCCLAVIREACVTVGNRLKLMRLIPKITDSKEQGDHHADRYVAPEFHGESR